MPAITDSPFPILTETVTTTALPGGSPPSGTNGHPRTGNSVLASLSEILGWRINLQDPAGIRRALGDAFTVSRDIEGKTAVKWNPRGFRVQVNQSGVSAITGSQRSLLDRAETIVGEIRSLLKSLLPLTSEPDWEDVHAIQSLLEPELDELIEQFGAEGGPVVQRVDTIFELMMDYDPEVTNPTFADPATVTGQLGLLRNRLGLVNHNVNTVAEELRLTRFHTLVNYIDMLRMTWHAQRTAFNRVESEAFLGTHSVLIERALSVVAESVQEVYRACNSVFLGAAERAVVSIEIEDTAGVAGGNVSRVTLAELLDWIDDVATSRGFDIIRSGGKDGIIHALAPTLARLVFVLNQANEFIGEQRQSFEADDLGNVELPAALLANRVAVALLELQSHLENASTLTSRIRRFNAPEIEVVRIGGREDWSPEDRPIDIVTNRDAVRFRIIGGNFQQDVTVLLTAAGRAPLEPEKTIWRDSSRLSVDFVFVPGNEGTWRLRILNPDGSETVTDDFLDIE